MADIGANATVSTAEKYARFSRESPRYEEFGRRVSSDGAVLDRLERLPAAKRQPNLLFTAVAYLAGVPADHPAFRDTVLARCDDINTLTMGWSTQTNEAGRRATLLPFLSRLPQPLALLEVGAGAGLCLFPDRYGCCYFDARGGRRPSARRMRRWSCRVGSTGSTCQPLDVAALAAHAPFEATLVVSHSAVLAYLDPADRTAFARTGRGLDVMWISNESPAVSADLGVSTSADRPDAFLISVDGVAWALGVGHGFSASALWAIALNRIGGTSPIGEKNAPMTVAADAVGNADDAPGREHPAHQTDFTLVLRPHRGPLRLASLPMLLLHQLSL